jgi:hypothetical protein
MLYNVNKLLTKILSFPSFPSCRIPHTKTTSIQALAHTKKPSCRPTETAMLIEVNDFWFEILFGAHLVCFYWIITVKGA